jgi:transposase-like protein
MREFPGKVAHIRWADPREHITPLMHRAELKMGLPIETILDRKYRGVDIARRLGVRVEQVTRWRKKLGIEKPKRS